MFKRGEIVKLNKDMVLHSMNLLRPKRREGTGNYFPKECKFQVLYPIKNSNFYRVRGLHYQTAYTINAQHLKHIPKPIKVETRLVRILRSHDEKTPIPADVLSDILGIPKRRIREHVLKLNSTPEAIKIDHTTRGYFIPTRTAAKIKMLAKQKRALMREVSKYNALKHNLEHEGNQQIKELLK